jgi:hypothetical protein
MSLLTITTIISIITKNSLISNNMTELAMQPTTLEVDFPFGEPDPDAVLLASGMFRVVSDYAAAAEEGIAILDEGANLDVVRGVCSLAAYRFERARFASMRRVQEPPKEWEIRYAPSSADRADAPTGAYAPMDFDANNGRATAADMARLEREGTEIAAYEASMADQHDRKALASDVTFAPRHADILQTSLRFAFLTADHSWQQREAIWVAHQHGFSDLAEELAASCFGIR